MSTAIPQTAEALFAQSGMGAPIFFNKDSVIGQSISGTVLEANPVQARDFDSGDLKFWDDGSPMMQLSITLSTNLREASIEGDKGERRHFVPWWGVNQKALSLAVSRGGDRFVKVGATMSITFTGLGEAKGRLSPPKLYAFSYSPPPSPIEVLMTAPTNGAAATVTTTAPPAQPQLPIPATQPTHTATTNVDGLAKIKKLGGAGFGIAEIHELVPEFSLDMIQAVLNI